MPTRSHRSPTTVNRRSTRRTRTTRRPGPRPTATFPSPSVAGAVNGASCAPGRPGGRPRPRAGGPAVEAIEGVQRRRPASPLRARARLHEQRLGGLEEHLAEQPLPRAEPAIDRRAPEAELGGDRLDVDTPTAEVVVEGGREHL